jgi:hypothetical protein
MRRTGLLLFLMLLMTMISGNNVIISELLASPQHHDGPPPPDPTLQKMQRAADKERNEQRQSQLKRDTDELYKLASELKKSVDSSNEHVLSLEVIRKAEAIEKLAKSVRTKMKADGYSSTIAPE